MSLPFHVHTYINIKRCEYREMQKKAYKMQWPKFGKRFAVWFLGIPINIVPVAFKQLQSITVGCFPGIIDYIKMIVSDFDFSFISLSVVFILCIEGFFAEDDLSSTYRAFQFIAVIYMVALLILYCVFFFRADLFTLMASGISFAYNLTIIILTFILGLLCNATISMKVSETS